ncbi:FtsX-like permease family protein [Homoserinimonas aerilata]|uniref:FtsX-like permease family protein n=1 Tax=Homoserinimonas aerilata TaxID=1162970 RepID=A0A542YJD8_9MICO|nr:FtsX-like permease family protein [Homoserinimonas aerilata]TQL48235.1 FtsX-like permease family protein [Homoserinimonas aerilata]
MTGDQVDVTIRVIGPSSPVAETRKALDDATAKAYGPEVSWSSTGWVSSDWRTTAAGVYSYLVELDDPAAEAELVVGRWPTSGLGIAMPEAAARSLGVGVGDTFTLVNDETPVELHVDGLYRSSPDSGVFWQNDPLAAAGNAVDFAEPGRSFYFPVHAVGPLIAAPNGVDASHIPPAQLSVVEHPSFTSTGVAGLPALHERVADAEIEIARAAEYPGEMLIIDTKMDTALDAVSEGLTASRAAALIIILLVLVVVAVAVASVTRLLADARAAEFELLRSRGASWLQTSLAVAIDATAIAIVVALASPWGGVLLHALIVGSAPLNKAGLEQWVLPDAAVWSGAIAFAVVIAALIFVPSVAPRQLTATTWAPAMAVATESAVVVAAMLMVWRIAAVQPEGGDLLLTATPAVLLIAAVIIGSRVLIVATRGIAALTSKARGAILPLGGWFAARGPGRSAGAVLIALTVGASVVILGVNATWQQSVQNEAAVALGAPARVESGDVSIAPSIAASAAPVMRRDALISKTDPAGPGGPVPVAPAQVLGLSAAARAVLDEGPAAEAGGSAITRALTEAGSEDTGPMVPTGAVSLQAGVAFEGPEGVVAEVSIALEDAAGTITVVPLGSITAGTAVTLVAPIASDGLQEDVRLVAATMHLDSDVPLTGETPAELTIGTLTALTAEGTATSSQMTLRDASSWRGTNSNDEAEPPTVTVTDSEIRLDSVVGVSYSPVTYGAVGWDPSGAISAVVPESLMDDLDVEAGAQLQGFIAGTPVSFRIVADTSGVPGSATASDLAALESGLPSPSRMTSTIVVDGKALVHWLVQASAHGPLVDEFWLSGEVADASLTSDSNAGAIVDTATLAQGMMEAPLRAEIPATSAIAVWASVLLALAGFGARTAAISRSRRLESAQLRALGLSRRGMLGVASADAGAVAAGGIVIGLGAGLVTLMLVGTRVVTASGGMGVNLVVPWQAVTVLPLVLLGALAVISVGIANGQRRLPLPDLLRLGADG